MLVLHHGRVNSRSPRTIVLVKLSRPPSGAWALFCTGLRGDLDWCEHAGGGPSSWVLNGGLQHTHGPAGGMCMQVTSDLAAGVKVCTQGRCCNSCTYTVLLSLCSLSMRM
jgi:hypothetical protein